MKKFNKVLAVALAVLMLMMTSIPAFADYWEMTEGEECYIEVPRKGYEEWIFVPEYSGCYVVDTYILYDEDSDADPYVQVYDEDGNLIVENDDYYDLESAVCFYAYEGEEYSICFFDNDDKKAVYEATINGCCGDYTYDGYCDGCGDLLCGCNCHQGGILGFFWSIGNFFNRLFRINEVCDCGAWHW